MSGKYKFLPSHPSEEMKGNTSVFQWRKMQPRCVENEKRGFFSRDGPWKLRLPHREDITGDKKAK